MAVDWRRLAWKACAGFLYHTRTIGLLRGTGAHRPFILGYHRVIPRVTDDTSFVQPGMYVTAATFEMHLRYLRSRYRIMPLDELVSFDGGDACAITFDDGWRDNYATAFPILRQYGLPATVFLATNLVGTARWPWPDRVCFYVHRTSPTEFSTTFESAWQLEVGTPLDTTVALRNRFAASEEVLRCLKRLDHEVLTRVVARVDDRFQDLDAVLHEQRPWLTWEEAREMAEHGISFGSHTENHVILTRVPLPHARREIVDSRRALAARVRHPVTSFCYPNGAYDRDIVRTVAEAGYRCAVTTNSGPLDRSAGPLESNRIMIHDDIACSRALFTCTLAGMSGFRQVRLGAAHLQPRASTVAHRLR